MAILKAYSIRDVRVEAYNRPSFVQNENVMRRSVEEALMSESHAFAFHPEDFQVFYIGEFDDQTGKFEPVAPEHVFNVVDCKKGE